MHDAPDTSSSSCRCTRCAADLRSLSAAARFCPNCGLRLSDGRPVFGFGPPDGPAPVFTPFKGFTGGILRGYANAMFRLGVHYEVRHNDDEATRCYGKASRLGNEPAAAKLGEIPLAHLAETADEAPHPAP